MTAANELTTGDLVPFRGQMISRADIPKSTRVKPVALETMDDALRYAKVLAASGTLPKSFYDADKNADPIAVAFVAIQLGAEVGLSPMASVQNIAVINGKPGLYGPAMLAVVEASGMMEQFDEWIEGEGDKMVACCKVKRFGRPERTVRFGMDDAKKANLSGKRGPWTEYPRRMLQARARTFGLRDIFPDVLLGLAYSVDELQDIPVDPPHRTIEATPEPAPPPPPKAEKPPFEIKLPGGWEPARFPRTKPGLKEALKFLEDGVTDGAAEVVGMNNELLDTIAEKMPHLAERVSELRAAAAEALAPDEPDPNATDAEPDDDPDIFPGDMPNKTDA
jgi:hypothetical protein